MRWIPPGETIETKVVERALKGYLADEFSQDRKSEAFRLKPSAM
jgi:hypothetical protein